MKENNSLALIITYYLSKFDIIAYKQLGFPSHTAAHNEIGRILSVNPNSIKNMRDEFDPLHENPRAGWYQRPLRPSRVKVVEAFQDMPEEELHDVVLEILNNPDFVNSEDFRDVVEPISNRQKQKKAKQGFIVRGPTGRRAEQIFIEHHQKTKEPVIGKLVDKRDYGCGYDFEIVNGAQNTQVEVKGLDGFSGGIVFTSKEWSVAKNNGQSYYLVIVRNVSETPEIQFIRNPAAVLDPKKRVFTTVQVNWNVGERELLKV